MERFIVADEELHDTPCQTERYGDRNHQDRWSKNYLTAFLDSPEQPRFNFIYDKCDLTVAQIFWQFIFSNGETINSFSGISDAFDTVEFGAASVDIDYILGIGTSFKHLK